MEYNKTYNYACTTFYYVKICVCKNDRQAISFANRNGNAICRLANSENFSTMLNSNRGGNVQRHCRTILIEVKNVSKISILLS